MIVKCLIKRVVEAGDFSRLVYVSAPHVVMMNLRKRWNQVASTFMYASLKTVLGGSLRYLGVGRSRK